MKQNRRTFMKATASATAATMLSPFATLASTEQPVSEE
jgi:hypothetical protein